MIIDYKRSVQSNLEKNKFINAKYELNCLIKYVAKFSSYKTQL